MTFLQPTALWLLGLIPVVVLIHLLRASPERRIVPSAFLWRGLKHDPDAARRWRPPPPTLALLLQILTIAALAVALAFPRLTAPPGRHVVVLLDASASMLATDAQPTRFGAAIGQARMLLAGLSPTDVATIVRVGPRPTTLANAVDPLAAQAALGDAKPGGGAAAMREALFFAADLARRAPDRDAELVVLSDGAFADPGDLAALGVPVSFETIGQNGENRAVTSLSVARQPGATGALTALAQITNYSDRAARVPVRMLADDIQQESRDVDLPARGRVVVTFNVPAGSRRVAAAVGGGDSLPADDSAEVAVEAGFARQVLLVSSNPVVMQRALRAIPDLRVDVVTPDRYHGAGAEIVVLDGVIPERLPRGQMLLVNPPPGRDFLPVKGLLGAVQFSDFDPRHPLLNAVDLSAARLAQAAQIQAPTWARVVAEAPGGPLILEGQESGRSVIVFGFDPAQSGFEKLIGFPLLVSNAVAQLGGGALSPSLPPGRPAILPVAPGVAEVTLDEPDGSRRALPLKDGLARIEGLELPGRYTVRERGSGAGEARMFAVNVADEVESQIAPRPRPAVEAPSAVRTAEIPTPFEPWPLLIGFGLLALSVEWWRAGRRG